MSCLLRRSTQGVRHRVIGSSRIRIAGSLESISQYKKGLEVRWHVNPEEALRSSNAKFERRVRYIEARLKEQGRDLKSASLAEQESLYQTGKRREGPSSM